MVAPVKSKEGSLSPIIIWYYIKKKSYPLFSLIDAILVGVSTNADSLSPVSLCVCVHKIFVDTIHVI